MEFGFHGARVKSFLAIKHPHFAFRIIVSEVHVIILKPVGKLRKSFNHEKLLSTTQRFGNPPKYFESLQRNNEV